MLKIAISILILCYAARAFPLTVSPEHANQIGERIWKNECAGSVEGLTTWNRGENFASLGIGHFIWYCQDKKERFEETFPDLLLFLQKKGVGLPAWLRKTKACPWNSRDEFITSLESPEMKSLRALLLNTKGLQAAFIANRLETTVAQILDKCALKERAKISALFKRMAKEPNGLYALIDYVNFKGTGLSESETYQGQGWGLLQVLQGMPEMSEDPIVDFVLSAKTVLNRRVKNAPPERTETKWLKGWHNRLDTYLCK